VAGEIAGSLDMSDIAKGSYFIGRLSNMDIKSLMQLVLPANVYKSFKLPEWLATCGFPGDMEMSYSFGATTTPTGMRALYFRFMHHLAPQVIRLVHFKVLLRVFPHSPPLVARRAGARGLFVRRRLFVLGPHGQD
jgi:hypothetical protein